MGILIHLKQYPEDRRERALVLADEFYKNALRYRDEEVFQGMPVDFAQRFTNIAEEVCIILSGVTGSEVALRASPCFKNTGQKYLLDIFVAMDRVRARRDEGGVGMTKKEQDYIHEKTFLFLRTFLGDSGRLPVETIDSGFVPLSPPSVHFQGVRLL